VSLLAVHISDGVLSPAWWGAGAVLAALLLLPALFRIADDEIPRIGLLTAAFFVASSIHVKVGATSVHLILNSLVGVVLGRRAPLAVSVGLLLQAWLLAHGGFTTIGVNSVVICVPALLAAGLFPLLAGDLVLPGRRRAFWAGFVTGFVTVVLTAALNAVVLVAGGIANWAIIAAPQFVIYLLLAVIEGLILGVTIEFLVRVKPELLRLSSGDRARSKAQQPVADVQPRVSAAPT
jgi:cobalt/nickel transport system permease protein